MAFQNFFTYGAINRDTITTFVNDVSFEPLFTGGQTVFDRTQENNMAWIDNSSGKGIMKSGDMFTTNYAGFSAPFQFSWVSPRTGTNDNRVKAGLDDMEIGDGEEVNKSGDSCVGFTYNYSTSSSDLLAVQFSGVCELRATGTFNQGDLIKADDAGVGASAGQGVLTSTQDDDNTFGIQLNDYNYGSGGYVLAKVNCSEKF
tara:strand:+ start:6135 stop:6737 length:603 start_codon:yes stop_codon:yes gene_type:complete